MAARTEYHRKWRAANPDKVKAYYERGREGRLDRSRRWAITHRDQALARSHAHARTDQARYRALLKGAVKRGLEVSLTADEYYTLHSDPCFYCGDSLPETGHGIDRKDSSVGYTRSNCRPCCTICNIAKNNMSENEFKEWIVRTHDNWLNKK